MEHSISTYEMKRQWILLSALAILLCIASFFAPSRLTEYPLTETIEFIQYGNYLAYLSLFSLLLIPIIVLLIASNKFGVASALTSLYIVFQLDNYGISRLLSFNTKVLFVYLWFSVCGLVYTLLYKDFRKSFLKNWARVLLIIFAGLFTSANFFLTLHPALRFVPFGLFTMFSLTFMLFSASNRLSSIKYWLLLTLLFGLSLFMITQELNCNIEFFGDMGMPNNNLIHMLNECSTYYIWLSIGFIVSISLRKKMKISAEQKV